MRDLKKWIGPSVVVVLVGGLWAAGCGGDDSAPTPTPDSGTGGSSGAGGSAGKGGSAGAGGSAGKGGAAEGGASVTCGSASCTTRTLGMFSLTACCPMENPNVCGFQNPLAPGSCTSSAVAPDDPTCPMVFIPMNAVAPAMTVPGCCLADRTCGANLKQPAAGVGCTSLTSVGATAEGGATTCTPSTVTPEAGPDSAKDTGGDTSTDTGTDTGTDGATETGDATAG